MQSILLHWLAVPRGPQRLANPHQGTFASSSVVRGTRGQLGNSQPIVKNLSTPQGQVGSSFSSIIIVVVIVSAAARAKLMKRVCKEVVRKKGAATGF